MSRSCAIAPADVLPVLEMILRCVALAGAFVACGRHAALPAAGGGAAPITSRDAATPIELPARALGMPDLASYAWRKRAGQPAFRTARKAEGREDWPGVVAACRQALAADPGHLEAAWLLAVALARTGKPDDVLAPLAIAAAGDFGKWATASLEQPGLQSWLATPTGEAWRRRVEQDRPLYVAILARSIIISAGGDLFAFDRTGKRFYRLTRTYGGVIGALAVDHQLAYVTRTHGKLGVGVIDLATGRASHPTPFAATGAISVAYARDKPAGFWVGGTFGARLVDLDGKVATVPAKPLRRPPGPWLEISAAGGVHHHRLPIADVTADWDDKTLASAIRVGTSNRIVAAPSPGLIDGNTIVWSPDRAHLAFVAQLDEQCKPGTPAAAAYVADAATGTVQELERATGGLAIEWVADRELAVAGDRGVSLVGLGDAPTVLDGATGLVTPKRKPRCTPDVAEPEPIDEDSPETTEPDAGVGSSSR